MNFAVIDLGTNTFNLLIARIDELNNKIEFIHKSKAFVKLSKVLVDKKEFKSDSITRCINALEKFLNIINENKVEKIYPIATAAIRNAKNNEVLIEQVRKKLGLDIKIIDGNEEAELIFLGVKQTYKIDKPVLIVDIGGGSSEFIIAKDDNILWKRSYPFGVGYLYEKFSPSDPITIEEIEMINNFLKEQLVSLFSELQNYNIDTLIGASGSFETIYAMINKLHKYETEIALEPLCNEININDFENLYWELVNSTVKDRKKMKGLESNRVDYIVIASIIIKFLLENTGIKKLCQSSFSMKEGACIKIFEKQNINA